MEQPDAAPAEAAPVADAQRQNEEFAARVLTFLRTEAASEGVVKAGGSAMLLMSASLRFVLDVGGAEVARLYWAEVKAALEQRITLMAAQPTEWMQ